MTPYERLHTLLETSPGPDAVAVGIIVSCLCADRHLGQPSADLAFTWLANQIDFDRIHYKS